MRTDVKLIIINQTLSESFSLWLNDFAETHGPIELWTGSSYEATNHHVIVKYLPRYDRKSSSRRLLTWLRFTVMTAWLMLFVPRRVPIFGVTNPPFTPLLLVIYRRILGFRYGLLEYDIYPQVMNKMGMISERNFFYRLWYLWHRWALSEADIVITLAEIMASELQSMTKDGQISVEVIPTWTDTDWLKPLPKSENSFAIEHNLIDKFVVLYSGNLGATHAVETILDVAERLRTRSFIQFVIIGEGSKKAIVEEAIVTGKTPNIRLLTLQPKDRLPYSLSSADIAIVTLGEGYERLSMPSKTYDMMAAGNAILGISGSPSNLETILKCHNCGVNFSQNQVEAITLWIESLANHPERLETLQIAARQAAVESFSSKICQPKLTQIINSDLILS